MTAPSREELAGRVAIVTGASRNIGRAIAVALGAGGASVLVHANTGRAEAEATADLVRKAGGQASVKTGDLADPSVPSDLVAAALEAFGSLDAVVANASIRPEAPLQDLNYESWRRVMAISLDSVFLLAKAALGPLRRSDQGTIVTIGGLSGHAGGPRRAHVVPALQV
jgi:3-oxoacyl-[acyl-carrier protein] reductase